MKPWRKNARRFPPLQRKHLEGRCKCGKTLKVKEKRRVGVESLWGRIEVARYRYRCVCGQHQMKYGDDSLDESGWLPEALRRVQDACTRVSYREAEEWLGLWGITTSKSQLGRIAGQLDQQQQKLARSLLETKAQQPLPNQKTYPQLQKRHRRWWCIEVDGVIVPTQMEGGTEWREVKNAVIYPMHCPSQRHYVSQLGEKDAFTPLVHGLLRVAGVKPQDRLIGITDGASWIAELMGDLGVWRHVLDVYHAAQYLDTLMLGMGWSDALRLSTRSSLLRGQLDLQSWLNHHAPEPNTLSEAGQKALAYLHKQTLLGHTAYPQFKAEGIEVIGSGQIEGANKHIIGARLKRSGCRWKPNGASAKALVRSQFFSVSVLIPFDQVRFAAFPSAA